MDKIGLYNADLGADNVTMESIQDITYFAKLRLLIIWTTEIIVNIEKRKCTN